MIEAARRAVLGRACRGVAFPEPTAAKGIALQCTLLTTLLGFDCNYFDTTWQSTAHSIGGMLLGTLVLFVALLSSTPPNVASHGQAGGAAVVDFQQCDRECRWHYGFYDRRITGVRIGALGHNNSWGRSCRCYKDGKVISDSIPRTSLKAWDDAEFWCGNGGNSSDPGFNTSYVCVADASAPRGVRTTTRSDAKSRGDTVVHCGKCSACSSPADVRVLYSTRHFITTEMTRCAAKFAKPPILGGDPNLTHLKACLVDANITFDDTVRFETGENSGHGPTCMECWTDNIMCDSTQCNTNPSCILKFFNPHNTGAFSGCLKCDETHCGAEFIKCAGANRRSSGIMSDIQRAGQEVCDKGWYWPCSECHAKCGKGDDACNNKCEALESCKGPR